jgi:RHH-type transcriptional regulator, rel operon repressor / antitoxin RelB
MRHIAEHGREPRQYPMTMTKETVSFRLEGKRREELDELAKAMDRDRSWLINEAIEAYLDAQRWQLDQIREGLRQAETGEFATEDEMERVFRRTS